MSDNRLRVGFVVHVMQIAGAELLIAQLIEELQGTIEPTIFCLDAEGELGTDLRDKGVPLVVFHRKDGIDWRLPFRLASEIRRRRIDILHAHQYTPFFYSALSRLCGSWGTRILITEHGRHYPDIVSWKRRFANRFFLSRLCTQATACCDFSATALESLDGFSHVTTIPNGVNVAKCLTSETSHSPGELRSRLGLRADFLYAACIARFHPVKDHATLIRSWVQVIRKLPQARLILVGDGSERTAMEELTRRLGIEDSVEFWGVRRDVLDILKAVDVFALSSVSEASSLTLLEAMACECPVVLTDVGGNAEHVTDQMEGFLVPRGDDAAMSAQLIRLLEDEGLRNRMGAAGRERVLAKFDLKMTIDRYQQLYLQMSKG